MPCVSSSNFWIDGGSQVSGSFSMVDLTPARKHSTAWNLCNYYKIKSYQTLKTDFLTLESKNRYATQIPRGAIHIHYRRNQRNKDLVLRR